jgi:hypothetical protein
METGINDYLRTIQGDPVNNPIIDANGTKRWRNERGQLHRLDGPAYIIPDGSQCWYLNDKLHRLDGPAVESDDGYKEYWIHGNDLTEEEFNEITQSPEHLNWYLLQIL